MGQITAGDKFQPSTLILLTNFVVWTSQYVGESFFGASFDQCIVEKAEIYFMEVFSRVW